jgi:dTDP-4-dehydrorhamnose 3,5-epimerase
VLSDEVVFTYKCTDLYHPEDEQGVLWSDVDLNIDWQLSGEPILSEKDKKHQMLKYIPEALLPRFQG